MMDHSQAVRMGAAERYLLDQLDDDEREQFEEHFFDCRECAEDVKIAEAFLDATRAVLADGAKAPAVERRRWGWRALFWPMPLGAAAAIALLVAVVSYQNLSAVPRLQKQLAEAEAPQPASWHFLAVSRGEPPAITVSPRRRMVGLTLGMPAGPTLPSYRCEVRDASGRVVWTFAAPAPARGSEIEIVLPAARLRPGSYSIVLAAPGDPRSDLARYPFTVELGED